MVVHQQRVRSSTSGWRSSNLLRTIGPSHVETVELVGPDSGQTQLAALEGNRGRLLVLDEPIGNLVQISRQASRVLAQGWPANRLLSDAVWLLTSLVLVLVVLL